eukprot:4451925-Ditylum_brightwellii.AAC.1
MSISNKKAQMDTLNAIYANEVTSDSAYLQPESIPPNKQLIAAIQHTTAIPMHQPVLPTTVPVQPTFAAVNPHPNQLLAALLPF